MSPITYANWPHLPDWIGIVMDDSWRVTYGRVGVREGSAHSVWCLKRNGDSIVSPAQLRITVHVDSRGDGDGTLDIASSKRAARRCLANIINSTAFLIESVWTRRDLTEFGEYSVRYADGAGCIAIAASQTVIEICDNRTVSSKTFNWCVRKILEDTVSRDSPPVAVPIVNRGSLVSLTSDDHGHSRPGKIQVGAVKSRFSLWFELEKPIAAADATVEGSAKAVSFENYVVEEGVKVEFTLVVKRLGHHIVDVHAVSVADSETMVSASQMAEVEVFTYNWYER